VKLNLIHIYKNPLKLIVYSFCLLERPAVLSDYSLTKPHEIENADSAEAPNNEDEDTGGEPYCSE
jgi:hypothetical protein